MPADANLLLLLPTLGAVKTVLLQNLNPGNRESLSVLALPDRLEADSAIGVSDVSRIGNVLVR